MLKIKQEIYSKLFKLKKAPPESGGILGWRNGIICKYTFDYGLELGDFYVPNTEYLNRIISLWQNEGISTLAIYHTHPHGYDELSPVDIQYASNLLEFCSISNFYFFIVIPQESIFAYKASMIKGHIEITEEEISIEGR